MRKGHGEKRSRKQQAAIVALLGEPTIKQAAEKAGIGEATLRRWMQLPDFNEEYRSARKQSVSQAVSRLQQLSGEAVETLKDIMSDTSAPQHSRVTAAKTIIEMTLKAVEIEELESRIEQLEKIQDTHGLRAVK